MKKIWFLFGLAWQTLLLVIYVRSNGCTTASLAADGGVPLVRSPPAVADAEAEAGGPGAVRVSWRYDAPPDRDVAFVLCVATNDTSCGLRTSLIASASSEVVAGDGWHGTVLPAMPFATEVAIMAKVGDYASPVVAVPLPAAAADDEGNGEADAAETETDGNGGIEVNNADIVGDRGAEVAVEDEAEIDRLRARVAELEGACGRPSPASLIVHSPTLRVEWQASDPSPPGGYAVVVSRSPYQSTSLADLRAQHKKFEKAAKGRGGSPIEKEASRRHAATLLADIAAAEEGQRNPEVARKNVTVAPPGGQFSATFRELRPGNYDVALVAAAGEAPEEVSVPPALPLGETHVRVGPAIERIWVWGERNSGTGLTQRLLDVNFAVRERVIGGLPWKHDYPRHWAPDDGQTLHVLVTKSPYAWLRSMRRRPIAFEGVRAGLPFSKFLAHRLSHGSQAAGRAHDKEAPRPVVAMRTLKLQGWRDLSPGFVYATHIRYEDLLDDPVAVLNRLAADFPLIRAGSNWTPRLDCVVAQGICTSNEKASRAKALLYLEHLYLDDYSADDIRLVQEQLDEEVERWFGYGAHLDVAASRLANLTATRAAAPRPPRATPPPPPPPPPPPLAPLTPPPPPP